MEREYHPISPKDVFMHFLSIIMLYASAISFLTVIFQLTNINIVDLAAIGNDTWQFNNYFEILKGALAFLVVTYPIFIATTWMLKKSYVKEPYKKEMGLRRWLVYFTLFIAALIIIGNLIALLIGYLYGELTLRFALKILAVFFVAGCTFGYYINDLKNKYDKYLKILAIIVSIIVIVAMVFAFIDIGSPAKQRLYKLDNQKIINLEMLSSDIDMYVSINKKLPENINKIDTSVDAGEFNYKIISEKKYKICAEFKAATHGYEFSQKYNVSLNKDNWDHDAGYQCFEKTSYYFDELIKPEIVQ